MLDASPDNADALHLLGVVENRLGDPTAGLALVERALRLKPGLVEAWLNRGTMLREAGRLGAAARNGRALLLIDPGHAAGWLRLGGVLCETGSGCLPQAITACRRAVRLDPGAAIAHSQLATALRQSERLDEAIACQRHAVALDPGGAGLRMSLGNALLERGRRQAARQLVEEALALEPRSPECWYNLGNVLHAGGNLERAALSFARAARLGLDLARNRLAAVLLNLGRPREAERELRATLGLAGADAPDAIERLAGLMLAEGRRDEMRGFFGRLATVPLAGRGYPVECRTALAAVDLAEGQAAAALQRLRDVESTNCWMFTQRSLAAFRVTLDREGRRLERPRGDARCPRITSSTLASRGRFAHNVLEYVLLRLYAERCGLVLETPDWVGGTFFELDDPAPSGPLPPLLFGRHILNDLVLGPGRGAPVAGCDVLSPLFLFEHRVAFRDRVQAWLRPRREWLPFLEPLVAALRARGGTLIALHIRRGDFVALNYPRTETAWYVDWLRQLWPTLDRPVLYVASDDRAGVVRDFAIFEPLTREDLVPEWPALDFLQDFHVLTQADVVGISAASGFSRLAARLNRRASLFAEPDPVAGVIRPFVPWI